MLKSQDGYFWWEESGMLKAWWNSLGSWCLGCCCTWTRLWPAVWKIHASLQSVWDGPWKQSAPLALWKPPISPVLSCWVWAAGARQSPPGRFVAAAPCVPVAHCSWYSWSAAVASLPFLITKRGHFLLFSCIRSGVAWWWEQNDWEVLGVLNLAPHLTTGYSFVLTCFSRALESC